jgi:hypothetical protein
LENSTEMDELFSDEEEDEKTKIKNRNLVEKLKQTRQRIEKNQKQIRLYKMRIDAANLSL